MRVALCILCHNRPAELRSVLQSAAHDSWDEIIVVDSASDPPLEPAEGTAWIRSERNLGVTGGRNLLAELAASEALVFLDDDALLLTVCADRVRRYFASNEDVAVLAFRVERTDGALERYEQPFRKGFALPNTEKECAYFIGCGYAARKAALDEQGGYDERLFYSNEELDLAFSLVRKKWRILYVPEIRVEHRPSVHGRPGGFASVSLLLRNRTIVARKHLPAAFVVTTAVVWSLSTLPAAVRYRAFRLWFTALRDGFRWSVHRRPLTLSQVVQVHRLGGRVLW